MRMLLGLVCIGLGAIDVLAQSSPAEYLKKAQDEQTQGKVSEAVEDYSRAIEGDAKLIAGYLGRGKAKWEQGNLDEAIADFSRTIELDPNNAEAFEQRALMEGRKRNYDAALQDYDRAIELNPKSSSAYAGRGRVRRRKDQLAEAAADYTEALKLNPDDRTSFYERGGVYFEKQEWKEARDDFGKAATLFSAATDHSPFYAWIASARLGQRNDASQSLIKYVRKLKKERLATTPTLGLAENLGPHPITQWEVPTFARSEKRTELTDDDRRWAIAIGEFLTGKLSEQQFFAADPSPSHFAGGPRGLRPLGVQSYDAWFFAGEKALLRKDATKAADCFNKSRHAYGSPSSDGRLARAELKALGQWSEEEKPK